MNSAYVAGFFDGEGCVMCGLRGGRHIPHITVSLGSTNLEILQELQSAFGGRINASKSQKAHYKKAWNWQLIRHEEIFAFLELIQPFVRVKKPQVDAAIACKEAFANIRGQIMPESVLLARLALRVQLTEMNKRGRVDI
jgi:hypothetical protein